MSKLTANLKLYVPFQNRFITVLYLIQALLFTLLFIHPERSIQMTEAIKLAQYPYTPIAPFFISMFLFGILASYIQYGILLKPVSYILPDHDRIRLKVILLFGAAASLLFFLIFILLPLQTLNFKYVIWGIRFTPVATICSIWLWTKIIRKRYLNLTTSSALRKHVESVVPVVRWPNCFIACIMDITLVGL